MTSLNAGGAHTPMAAGTRRSDPAWSLEPPGAVGYGPITQHDELFQPVIFLPPGMILVSSRIRPSERTSAIRSANRGPTQHR